MKEPWMDGNYVNLETVRQDGTAVATPLWFVWHEDKLYLRTPGDSWKVKRIQRQPQVRVAPCDMRGTLQGEWIAATAKVYPAQEMAWLQPLILQKYGFLKRLMDWRNKLLGKSDHFAVIEILL